MAEAAVDVEAIHAAAATVTAAAPADLPFEELMLLHNPYDVSQWLLYIEEKQQLLTEQFASLTRKQQQQQHHNINIIFERAVHHLPYSYKLWYTYLQTLIARATCSTHRVYSSDNSKRFDVHTVFQRCLSYMQQYPLIWTLYINYLLALSGNDKQQHGHKISSTNLLSFTRSTINAALVALPITQHNTHIWPLAIQKFIQQQHVPLTTAVAIYKRYLQLNFNTDIEAFIAFLVSRRSFTAAATELQRLCNNSKYTSANAKSRYQLFIELIQLCTKHANDINTTNVLPAVTVTRTKPSAAAAAAAAASAAAAGPPAINVNTVVATAINLFPQQLGVLSCLLASFHIQQQNFAAAQRVYATAINTTATTTTDFVLLFDAYSGYLETMCEVYMTNIDEDEQQQAAVAADTTAVVSKRQRQQQLQHTAQLTEELNKTIHLLEQLVYDRPLLLNNVQLRAISSANSNGSSSSNNLNAIVAVWLERIALFEKRHKQQSALEQQQQQQQLECSDGDASSTAKTAQQLLLDVIVCYGEAIKSIEHNNTLINSSTTAAAAAVLANSNSNVNSKVPLLWLGLAQLYEHNHDNSNSRDIYERAVARLTSAATGSSAVVVGVEALASVYCAYVEFELRQYEAAVDALHQQQQQSAAAATATTIVIDVVAGLTPAQLICERALAVHSGISSSNSMGNRKNINSNHPMRKSTKLWSLYLDILMSACTPAAAATTEVPASAGTATTVETAVTAVAAATATDAANTVITNKTRDAAATVVLLRQCFDLLLLSHSATPAVVLCYCDFLLQHRYHELCFRTFEQSVSLFTVWPQAQLLWLAYLRSFISVFAGSKLERTRELFEQAIAAATAHVHARGDTQRNNSKKASNLGNNNKDSKAEEAEQQQMQVILQQLYMLYIVFEQQHGLERKGMSLFERATNSTAAGVLQKQQQLMMYLLYTDRVLQVFGLLRVRSVFAQALQQCDSSSVPALALRYASLEARVGEHERARQLYVFAAQHVDTRTIEGSSWWQQWHKLEVRYGSAESYREMLRVKRTVQALYAHVTVPVSLLAATASSGHGNSNGLISFQKGATSLSATAAVAAATGDTNITHKRARDSSINKQLERLESDAEQLIERHQQQKIEDVANHSSVISDSNSSSYANAEEIDVDAMMDMSGGAMNVQSIYSAETEPEQERQQPQPQPQPQPQQQQQQQRQQHIAAEMMPAGSTLAGAVSMGAMERIQQQKRA